MAELSCTWEEAEKEGFIAILFALDSERNDNDNVPLSTLLEFKALTLYHYAKDSDGLECLHSFITRGVMNGRLEKSALTVRW